MANRENIAAKVRGIIASQLELDISDIDDEMDLMGEDSLKQVEIVLGIEDEFSLKIPETTSKQWHKVGEVIEYVQGQSGG